MATRRLDAAISRLETTQKWVLGSALAIGVSALLPWYEDVDAFGAGDLYLGITGPLFLVGLLVLGSAAFVAYWIVAPTMGRRLPSLPFKDGALFAFVGVQNLLLLLVANSVFFHPKFGVNITLKNTKFGMILALASVVVMIWSGYRLLRQSERRAQSIGPEGRLEPLIKMPETQPTREPRAELHRDPTHYSGSRHAIGAQTHGPVERAIHHLNNEPRLVRKEPVERDPSQKIAPQPLRMDL